MDESKVCDGVPDCSPSRWSNTSADEILYNCLEEMRMYTPLSLQEISCSRSLKEIDCRFLRKSHDIWFIIYDKNIFILLPYVIHLMPFYAFEL